MSIQFTPYGIFMRSAAKSMAAFMSPQQQETANTLVDAAGMLVGMMFLMKIFFDYCPRMMGLYDEHK